MAIKTKKKKSRKKSKKTKKFSWIKFLFKVGIILAIPVALYLVYCALTLPDIEHAVYRDRTPATTILAENGNEIYTFGTIYSEVVYLKDLPDYIPNAIIATEDRRFYSHFGIDFISLARAMLKNIIAGRYAQGASTISQQVAKNLFLTPNKNITRKVQELMMAFWLEKKFTKEQILTLYLNRVYLGAGTYGIEAASQRYFQKQAADMNILEAAVIAGMLKAPSRYNPASNKELAIERAQVVLNNMLRAGFLTEDDKAMALKMRLGNEKSYRVEGARHFADWVYNDINNLLGEREEDVYALTTLDPEIQEKAEKILKEEVAKNRHKNVSEGAIVIMDYSGAVKAMVGGVDYNSSQFNRATQALRQPGSTFKTFVYLTAVMQGWGSMDKIDDVPIQIKKWKPENFDKKYYGSVTLLYAITKSLNLATINLLMKVGTENVIKTAKDMGISTKIINSPSLALGTFEVKVLDIASAYTAIANGGKPVFPYAIREIFTKDGYQLYMREAVNKKSLFNEKTAKIMREMLANVINSGTGAKAKLNRNAFGKSGTSQNYRDAWFVGFTDDLVCAVWVGNDDNSPMKNITGGGLPAEIWKKVMEY